MPLVYTFNPKHEGKVSLAPIFVSDVQLSGRQSDKSEKKVDRIRYTQLSGEERGKGSYLRERLTVQEEESAVQDTGEQYSREESGAAQRGRGRQFYWESFTETD